MQDLIPQVPQRLDPLARDVLAQLKGQPDAAHLVLGGGVALQHYCAFRSTRDLDAWWHEGPEPATEALLENVLARVGSRHGMDIKVRRWGETQSYELQSHNRTVFSFQIAMRSVQLEPPLTSAWAPVQIETFRDNVGAKMNALVARGAPRDFLDVHQLARRGLVTTDDLWTTWHRKNRGVSAVEACAAVLRHLELLEARRPLSSISDEEAYRNAEQLRRWVRDALCRETPQ